MSWSTIRSALKTTIEGVSNAGRVYDHIRYEADIEEVKELYTKLDLGLRVWFISRSGGLHEFAAFGGKYFRNHNAVIDFLMAVDDANASENTFNDLIDSFLTALEPKKTLSGVAFTVQSITWAIDRMDFGGSNCHHCQFRMVIQELINVTWS